MAAPQSAAPAPESAKTASTSNGGLITVDGVVYRATGTDASVTEEGLSRQGSTTTSLDTGDAPTSRDVLGTGDPARVFLVGEDDAMLGFDRVTTTFQGITYTLTSGPIPSYADPLTLPEGIPQPTDSDGSPVFTPVDDVQPPVYVRDGSDPSQGIALRPGSPTDISAEWTWWVPARD